MKYQVILEMWGLHSGRKETKIGRSTKDWNTAYKRMVDHSIEYSNPMKNYIIRELDKSL